MDLHHIRQEYSQRELSEKECHKNPLIQFKIWLDDAINTKVNEPTAMNLATVNQNGKPSARIVLLKEVNETGFVFFSNYHSTKGMALENCPFVALTFFWPELERQIRIEGNAQKLPENQSDDYFHSRPHTSQLGAWASEQSSVIKNKNILLARAAMFAAKYPLHVPRPPHWGGYLVIPHAIEFWQGRPSRLHDRIRYHFFNHSWSIERLAP